MINLTKLNGQSFILNCLYIEQIQALPDTTITLTNGKILVVHESVTEVIEKSTEYMKNISVFPLTGMKEDHRV